MKRTKQQDKEKYNLVKIRTEKIILPEIERRLKTVYETAYFVKKTFNKHTIYEWHTNAGWYGIIIANRWFASDYHNSEMLEDSFCKKIEKIVCKYYYFAYITTYTDGRCSLIEFRKNNQDVEQHYTFRGIQCPKITVKDGERDYVNKLVREYAKDFRDAFNFDGDMIYNNKTKEETKNIYANMNYDDMKKAGINVLYYNTYCHKPIVGNRLF